MGRKVQQRGGTTAEHSSFTGAIRETTVDTTKNTVIVHDGFTPGGHALATESKLNDEITIRTNAVNAVDTKVNTEKARVDAILSASDADKDTFAEIVTLVNTVDTENDDALAGYVTSNNTRSGNIEQSVNVLNGDVNTVGSVANAIEAAKVANIDYGSIA